MASLNIKSTFFTDFSPFVSTGSTVVDFRWVIARVVKCFHIFLTPVLQQLSYVVGLGSDREKSPVRHHNFKRFLL